jgi:hypothetical protein
VGEYLDQWLAGRRALREGTHRSYANHIHLYLKPHLGHLLLERLRVADVDRVFEAIDDLNDLITRARESGDPQLRARVKGRRPVGPATKQRIRATLRSALTKAIKQRLIEVNVAALVELPSGKAPRRWCGPTNASPNGEKTCTPTPPRSTRAASGSGKPHQRAARATRSTEWTPMSVRRARPR